MKQKLITNVLISFIFSTISFVVFAEEVLEGKEVTKEVLIEKLLPNQSESGVKTRGIYFLPNGQPLTEKKKPEVSMKINFKYNSHELTDEAKQQLQPLGEALNSDKLAKFNFAIDGHTDAVGSEEYNMQLSQRRALSVGSFLHEKFGVDPDRLKLKGKGESELFDRSNPNASVNRRVQITTLVSAS